MNIIHTICNAGSAFFKKNENDPKGETVKISNVDLILSSESIKVASPTNGLLIEVIGGRPVAKFVFSPEYLQAVKTIRNDVVRWALQTGAAPDPLPKDEEAWLEEGRKIWSVRAQKQNEIRNYQAAASWEDFLQPVMLFEYICETQQEVDGKNDFGTVVAAFNKMSHFYRMQCSLTAYSECNNLDQLICFMIKKLARDTECYYNALDGRISQ